MFVDINPSEYYIVFSNILTNALESINPQEKKGQIKIQSSSLDGVIEVTVSDNGCGIQEESQNRIFDPFFSTKNVKHNLGLGLALCKEIIEADGGKIEIESIKSRGTNVKIFIREFVDEK